MGAPIAMLVLDQMFVFIAVPMVGFGFLDNVIMITAGDQASPPCSVGWCLRCAVVLTDGERWSGQIEASLGVTLGVTTLCAAGFGNMMSDLAGLGLGGYIEASADKLGAACPPEKPPHPATGAV